MPVESGPVATPRKFVLADFGSLYVNKTCLFLAIPRPNYCIKVVIKLLHYCVLMSTVDLYVWKVWIRTYQGRFIHVNRIEKLGFSVNNQLKKIEVFVYSESRNSQMFVFYYCQQKFEPVSRNVRFVHLSSEVIIRSMLTDIIPLLQDTQNSWGATGFKRLSVAVIVSTKLPFINNWIPLNKCIAIQITDSYI